jgi:hypothetical protein
VGLNLLGIWRYAIVVHGRCLADGVDIHGDYVRLLCPLPNTRNLEILTNIEWFLGVYMLIHFVLAVKNNLPFILPFLGVVN